MALQQSVARRTRIQWSLRAFLKQVEKTTFTPIKRAIRRLKHNRVPVRLNCYESYEAYRQAQNAGNLRKLTLVAAQEANIAHLARYASERLVRPDIRVLCHGTRNGAEQRWFRHHLPGAALVLGTEIADTAIQFPDTIQWDFH